MRMRGGRKGEERKDEGSRKKRSHAYNMERVDKIGERCGGVGAKGANTGGGEIIGI